MKRVLGLLICTLFGCDSSTRTPVTGWPFDPVQFFAGHTRGDAKLHLITGATRQVSVDSIGTPDGHGGLVLKQTIAEQGSSPRVRQWVLHPAGTNRWTGSLTDARGPVLVERTRNDVTIRYRMKNGAEVEQHLELPPGGFAVNHMSVSRFGIQVAALDERVRKVGA